MKTPRTPEELAELRAARDEAAAELAELRRWAAIDLAEVAPADLRRALDARRRWDTDGPVLRRLVKDLENGLSSAQREAAAAMHRERNAKWRAKAMEHRDDVVDLLDDVNAKLVTMLNGEQLTTASDALVGQLLRAQRELANWRDVFARL